LLNYPRKGLVAPEPDNVSRTIQSFDDSFNGDTIAFQG
jgi:hypothetical protein